MRVGLTCLLGLSLLCSACTLWPVPDDGEVIARTLSDRKTFRAGLEDSCADLPAIDGTISAAIGIGAPIYNAGSALGCYRIYEGAAYKLLYHLGDRCPRASAVLRAGLSQAEADVGDNAKAWTMRATFDAILGDETGTGGSLAPPKTGEL